ncbi:NAD(P)/FAD-dependent oxidoreductase [Flavimaricola marinus]|uniref:Benzene 1,2-dioxygenase system ferredoxin--NAD(+) reductase subunit n=1 Tax=Flavimaricola marinus TaxID=1819565 RepID=A0A238LGA7_9RHOB|nr:FAD-dependent oxidoreductase [Flavimaricola marinus]SMY08612.1 Benzene 1,2-dioxygenase system ferredoxin--NAD(+) reductase subunit [Flavimaricola marinus]
MTDLPAEIDVVIVGAGPAGLAAATVIAQGGGCRVVVLDREGQAGGVPRHCSHSPYGLREFRRLMTGPSYAKTLVEKAKSAGVVIHTGVNVTRLLPGPTIEVTSDAGPATIRARAVLLATGARETTRAERLIGGTKPQGVLSTGALQLLLETGQKPFHRPVILGTELVAFSALLSCRLAGIKPVAMIEPSDTVTARWPTGLFPRLQGTPLLKNTQISQIDGQAHVTGVQLSTGRTLQTDGLIVSGRFQPDAPLLARSPIRADPDTGGPEIDQFGRCSEAGYFAAGNLLRAVETAGWSWSEGRAIGAAIHAYLNDGLPADPGQRIRRSGPISALVPQRIAPGPALGLSSLQLRVGTALTGRLSLLSDGSVIAGKTLRSRPERRILLPLPQAGTGPEVRLEPRGSR